MKKGLRYYFLRIMLKMMLSCDKATFLISKKQHTKISIIENIQLRFHYISCEICKKYEEEIKIIDKALKKYSSAGSCSYHLNAEQKERMSRILEDHMHQ